MAKEMILLSKRQFDDLSRQVDKSNLDQVENGRNDGKGSVETNTTLSDASDMNRTFIENCTQTGKGFVFHQQESGDSVGPPGIPARKKRQRNRTIPIVSRKKQKTNINWLQY